MRAGGQESEMSTARTTIEAAQAIGAGATGAITGSDADKTRGNDQVHAIPGISEIVLRVEGEYREMPGLSLTLPQAARLWGLDCDTCERVLAQLVERRVLTRGLNGAYIRRSSG